MRPDIDSVKATTLDLCNANQSVIVKSLFKELAQKQALTFVMGTINDARRQNPEPGRTYLCKDVLQLIVSHML